MQSRKTLIVEITLAFVTGTSKLIFMDWLNWKLLFIAVIIVLWSVYVWKTYKKNPKIISNWGFRWDNFGKVFRQLFWFGIFAILVSLIVGYKLGTLNITWHIIPILILYPIWGTIQQFLVISLVAGNLQDLKSGINNFIIILITATLFGAVHYPYFWLIAGTFILALFYGHIFLKERNIYAMGFFHGWLGAVFFYTVVGRDPYVEIFGQYLK